MARSSSEIDAIIAGLKTNRDTRDAAIETAAAELDGSDDKNAGRLREFKHTKEKGIDKTICVHDRVKRDKSGTFIFMYHNRYDFADVTHGDGETDKGLRTLLVDEAFSVTGATTVQDL